MMQKYQCSQLCNPIHLNTHALLCFALLYSVQRFIIVVDYVVFVRSVMLCIVWCSSSEVEEPIISSLASNPKVE